MVVLEHFAVHFPFLKSSIEKRERKKENTKIVQWLELQKLFQVKVEQSHDLIGIRLLQQMWNSWDTYWHLHLSNHLQLANILYTFFFLWISIWFSLCFLVFADVIFVNFEICLSLVVGLVGFSTSITTHTHKIVMPKIIYRLCIKCNLYVVNFSFLIWIFFVHVIFVQFLFGSDS